MTETVMTNMVDLASRLAGFGPVVPGPVVEKDDVKICPSCETNLAAHTAAGATKCAHCGFPIGKDPDDYAVCNGCGDWYLVNELSEAEWGGWYCGPCLEEEKDEAQDCPQCHGSGGGMDEMRCPYCHGTGRRKCLDEDDDIRADMAYDEAVDRALEGRG